MTLRTTLVTVGAVAALILAGAAQAAPAAPTPMVKPAIKPKASPTRQGFFCNMTPPDPATVVGPGNPAPSGGLSTESGEHEGTGGHGDDKGGGKKDPVAAPALTPATLQTQQQTAPTPQ
jgi:hypothetical protein